MIETSKHPEEMASDGNMAVKTRVQCPQCRHDLKDSIHDTLILRRVETFKKLIDRNDSELTASELRQKHSLGMDQLTRVLETAQAKYTKFSLVRKSSSDSEEGVEVLESDEESVKTIPVEKPIVDSSLFPGLKFSMTDEEQCFVTALMISGEVPQLAQAAQILNGIAELGRKGITPSMRNNKGGFYGKSSSGDNSSNSSASSRPSDIENLVNVRMSPQQGRRKHTHKTSTISGRSFRTTRSGSGAVGRALAMGRTEADRKEQQRLMEIEQFKRAHPLPVRMPSYIILDYNSIKGLTPNDRKYPIQFADDEWDGSIADAFARVCVGRNSVVTRKVPDNAVGVANVLRGGSETHDNDVSHMISEPKKRVVISKVRGDAGRQGAQSGDVVTHLNGEPFEGNVHDLKEEIMSYLEREDHGDLSFVLNAETSTAEALKLRAVILALIP